MHVGRPRIRCPRHDAIHQLDNRRIFRQFAQILVQIAALARFVDLCVYALNVARSSQIHRIRLTRTQRLLDIFQQAGIEHIAGNDGYRLQLRRTCAIRRDFRIGRIRHSLPLRIR